MGIKPISIDKFDGGLNLTTSSSIKDNQFSICKNMFYNKKKQLETRRGIALFGGKVGSDKPITSYFFFQRDDTGVTTALCASGANIYKFDDTLRTRSSIKSGLTEFETATNKTSWRTRRDFAVYKNVIYMCNGIDSYASYNGTTFTDYAAQPKYRYVNMNTDRLFGTGVDAAPSTVYYSDAAPADGTAINTNEVVVGGDELGRINGMNELGNIMLVLKSAKIYSIDVTNEKAEPIDSQTGGFSDRTIANVGNSLVYFTERGVDTLHPRTGLSGTTALESMPLDEDIREITRKVSEFNYNANCGRYIKSLGNYYISLDTNDDNIPDTTLVYNARTKARTEYTYPNVYDYGYYIEADGSWRYVIASATTDQIYEIETGFDDLGELIEYEIQTKAFDFGEPGTFKTYDHVDIIGQKNKGANIQVDVLVDGELQGGATITDDMITNVIPVQTLGARPIGIDTLTGEGSEDVAMYNFIIRVPLYGTGGNIAVNMKSTGGLWILEKMRIGVEGQPIEVFNSVNIG